MCVDCIRDLASSKFPFLFISFIYLFFGEVRYLVVGSGSKAQIDHCTLYSTKCKVKKAATFC